MRVKAAVLGGLTGVACRSLFCILNKNQPHHLGDDACLVPVLFSHGNRQTISFREPYDLPVEIHIHLSVENIAQVSLPVAADRAAACVQPDTGELCSFCTFDLPLF
jgi:hypothetical protein